MANDIGAAYSARASEYIDLFGLIEAAHPADRHLIEEWSDGVDGAVLDAGCGPGHWSALIAERGRTVRGVDQVPEFLAHARRAAPGVDFESGDLAALELPSGTFGGVLAWYSLIHFPPHRIQDPLREFGRVLRPGGGLLIGFFDGASLEPFDHAITTAYRWPSDALAELIETAGFEVLETRTRTTKGQRPHAAITARRLAAIGKSRHEG